MTRKIEGAPVKEAAAVIYKGIRNVQELARTTNAVQWHSYDPAFVKSFGSTWENNGKTLKAGEGLFQQLDDFHDTNLLPEDLHEKLNVYRTTIFGLYEGLPQVDFLLDNPEPKADASLNEAQRSWFLQGRELLKQTYLPAEADAYARLVDDPLAQYYFSIGFRPRVHPYGTDFGVIYGLSKKSAEIPVEDRSKVLEATERYIFLRTTPEVLQDLGKLELWQPLAMRVLRKLVDEPTVKGIVEILARR